MMYHNFFSCFIFKYLSPTLQLAEVFEQEIDPVMQSLGYCCGRKYTFNPQVLCCYGKQLCTIPRDAKYYSYQNRLVLVTVHINGPCSYIMTKVRNGHLPCTFTLLQSADLYKIKMEMIFTNEFSLSPQIYILL